MVPLEYLLRFIEEDAPFGDVTSEAVIPEDMKARAVIIAKQNGVIAGVEEAKALFEHFGVKVEVKKRDGELVGKRDVILELEGNARAILLVERTALNVMGRMSGIATEVRKLVEKVKSVNPKVRVAGTRKTLLKPIDKRALLIGGGETHRFSLSDAILIKDNHLALVPLEEAIKRAKEFSVYKVVEVEVESLEDALKAARAGADVVMLDNMKPAEIAEVIEALKREGLREKVKIEVSGGITPENITEYAKLDVDVISLGYLTHSVKNFDVSLEIIGRL
ncbi:Nicotinate-nucleotide pyrophosphorylase [Thermococcus kodakarensis KOD1]|uniref:Nicotinate-nucleotide pyrophosphorylase [carboxylating] n=1 Tax=Thermococcus kodakarensis (strain ATCC BAA-918 / JCM 12380 / KOD1) TaxID=69014 RepID=Q5JFR0_THEKO|nr:carboxylating nicotinate-nucleotide diphosphorylase [Thermococcus kodakarensis]WCN28308.1 carboxylating nicotinate-nucleotide diphosphorylase [Thermococcus kodakarensis]WCN30603.1 carboxylating nicotinate-nucleotide diphosphorylase [Thermococcus kodakarensis]BAD84407.1 Nicotinate-nucleotide pyrophosphorylase [Thermococcus kodakarensis KOD1]